MERSVEHLKIETITPVSIGTGEVWSPITDYFVEDKMLYRIDKEKFQNLLNSKSKIDTFSKYVSRSVNESGTGTTIQLNRFIETELGTSPHDLTKDAIPYPNMESGKEQVNCCYQLNGSPIIPGSSIKGAIKTALFYHWLRKTPEGKATLDAIIRNLVPRYNEKWFRQEYPKKVEKNFLTKVDQNGRAIFSDLGISDTHPFDKQSSVILKTERIHLTKPQYNGVPQVKMCINKSSSSELTYKSSRWTPDIDFFQKMNVFAYNTILTEQEILYNHSNGVSISIKKGLNTFYDQMTNEIDRMEKTGEKAFFLRIGSGKSYFDNTIAMAIYEKDENAFKSLCKMYQLGKAPNEHEYRIKEPFPITRSIITDMNEPLGWVKISIK